MEKVKGNGLKKRCSTKAGSSILQAAQLNITVKFFPNQNQRQHKDQDVKEGTTRVITKKGKGSLNQHRGKESMDVSVWVMGGLPAVGCLRRM